MSILAADLQAQTTVSVTSSRDNSIYEENTGNSNGTGDLFFGRTNGGNLRRSLILFDIAAAIPAGATITDVSFDYNVLAPGNRPDSNVSFHRALADWGEGGSLSAGGQGVAAQANDATWAQSFFGSTNWTNAGGDFDATASDSFLIGSAGAASAQLTGLVDDVQSFLDNPGNNFGWFLLGDEINNQSARRISSRESASGQPTLQITFTAVPEPSSALVSVFGLALVALRRRRAQ